MSEEVIARHAKSLCLLAATHVVKETLQTRSRKSQAAALEARLKQAGIEDGYPRSLFHLCTVDATPEQEESM